MADSFWKDKIINYAIIFIYKRELLKEYIDYKPNTIKYEDSQLIAPNTSANIIEILNQPIEKQREMLDKDAEPYIRAFMEIVKKVKADNKLSSFALFFLNGILEDKRSRISTFITIQKGLKRRENIAEVLLDYIMSDLAAMSDQRDVACHILAQLLGAIGENQCQKERMDFINWLLKSHNPTNPSAISNHGFSFAIMHLLKLNDVCKYFYENKGVHILVHTLDREMDFMITTYNIMFCLWVLSFQHYAIKDFEDPKMEVILKVIRAIQMYNREKVVRISLQIFSNLTSSDKCIEIMVDEDLLKEVIKLMNRHWLDKSIGETLEKLDEILTQNYKVLSSFDKFRKQVTDGVLKWGPTHSEVFWIEHFAQFGEKDNIDLIKKIVELLDDSNETTRMIACYDLGEFARFYKYGKNVLDKFGAKTKILELMKSSNNQMREHALVSIQKIMLSNWQAGGAATPSTAPASGGRGK